MISLYNIVFLWELCKNTWEFQPYLILCNYFCLYGKAWWCSIFEHIMPSANVFANTNHKMTSTSLDILLFVTMEPIWALRALLTAVLTFCYEAISPPRPVYCSMRNYAILPWIGTRRSRSYNSNINGRFKVEARVNTSHTWTTLICFFQTVTQW